MECRLGAVISIFANYSTILFILFGIYIYRHILSKRKKKEKKITRNDLLNKLVPKEAFCALLDDCSKSV